MIQNQGLLLERNYGSIIQSQKIQVNSCDQLRVIVI